MISIAWLLCVLAPPAWADDPALAQPEEPSARRHFTQGNRLYRARNLDDAIAAYRAGAAIEPVPVFDYNLGQCYRKLGRHAEAIRHYERFLRNGRPEGELHALVMGFLRQLREELALTARLEPRAEPAPKPSPPQQDPLRGVDPPGRPGPAPTPAMDLSASAVARGEPWYSDRLGWGLVAGGAVGAAGAIYLRALALGLHEDAGAVLDEDRRVALRGATRTRNVAGVVLGAGSAALIATGAIRLVLQARAPSRTGIASWSVGVSGRGVAVLGRF